MPIPIETPYGPVEAVADWLRANDIDPNDVPIEGPIAIKGGRIEYAALLRNKASRHYMDEATHEAAREGRTTLLKVEPPTSVQVPASR
jgi:hypothetical protein